jgi:hypothetical protein
MMRSTVPCSRPPRTPIRWSCRLTVGSQWPGISHTVSPSAGQGAAVWRAQDAVLVAAVGEGQRRLAGQAMHPWQAAVDGVALVAGVAHGMRSALTQMTWLLTNSAVLEGGLRRVALVAQVVGVHEQVAAGLQFAPDAAGGLEGEGAGAGAVTSGTGRPAASIRARVSCAACWPRGRWPRAARPRRAGAARGRGRPAGRRSAGCWSGDRLRQCDGGLAGRHAAAALAHVDFDEDVDQRRMVPAASASKACASRCDALAAVHRNGQLAAAACSCCASAATRRSLAAASTSLLM